MGMTIMNMTKDVKTETNRIASFEKHLIDNLNQYLEQNSVSQQKLAILCKENGYDISQSTISRLCSGQRRITVYYIHAICHALGIKMDSLIDHNGIGTMRKEFLESRCTKRWISSDPFLEEQDFEAYLGHYYVYYLSTNIYDHGKIIKGRLSIEKRKEPPYCYAGIKIYSDIKNIKNESIIKYFEGQLVIVKHKNVAYIFVVDESDGEISIVMMRHRIYYGHSTMECRVGAALTVSTGEEKVPCLHRVVISRDALSDERLEYLKPIFKLGKDRVFILKSDYEAIAHTIQMPDAHMEKISKYLDEQVCLEISENILNEIHEKVLKEEWEDIFYKFQKELCEKDILGIENDSVNAVQDKKLYTILNYLKQQEGENI